MSKAFIICIFATILCLGSVSCSNKSNEDKIKEFAVDFADKASKNQIDSLKLVYPGIENADSVALKYVAEGIVVNPSEDGGVYEIILSPDATIFVNANEDGTYTVTESKGLFAYPQEKKDFATKTGLWDDSLNDTELAKRMNDEEFVNYINNIIKDKTTNLIIIKDARGETVFGAYEIKNLTDQLIKGSEYSILSRELFYGDYTNYSSRKGNDLPPHGSKIYEREGGNRWIEEFYGIKINIPEEELVNRFVKLTGNEYQEYLDSKTKESK